MLGSLPADIGPILLLALAQARAEAGIDGVFHPAYLEVHLGVAERLGRQRLLVLKGGGGEAERVPAKLATAHLFSAGAGRTVLELPASPGLSGVPALAADAALLAAVWRGEISSPAAVATFEATIALGLIALGATRSAEAALIWAARG